MLVLPVQDWAECLRWYGWLWLAGWLVWPHVARIFPTLHDQGYGLSRAIGLLAAGYAGWLFPALGLAGFAGQGPMLAIATLALGWGIMQRPVAGRPAPPAPPLRRIAIIEAIFATLFLLGLAQRLAIPDLEGLEKFTNLSFIMAVMQAETLPPEAPWLAGQDLNYYYLGHAITALWALLTSVSGDHAYQLMMATIFALTGLLSGQLVFELLRRGGIWIATLLGGLTGLVCLYGGNFHSLLYITFRRWMPATNPEFHLSDSTRFIGFDPDLPDKAFTEFPSYAFVAGDLHAHVLATPGFLAVLFLLLAVFRQARNGMLPKLPQAVALGWLLGLAFAMNSWDVAISGLAALAVWLAIFIRGGGAWIDRLDRIAAVALVTLIGAVATASPFAAGFTPFADGLAIAMTHSPAWQLLVLHGHALPGALALLWLLWIARSKGASGDLLFAAGLMGLAALLVLLPELVYVDDIYGDDHARANTMFKLTFRAHTLMLVAAMAAAGFLFRRMRLEVVAFLVAAPVLGTLVYAQETFRLPGGTTSLDGLAFLGDERGLIEEVRSVAPADRMAIIEAAGLSFTPQSRVSAVTGRPTILGWEGHEWLWRNSTHFIDRRRSDIAQFYETDDQVERCRIMLRYRMTHAVIAEAERDAHPDLDETAIEALGLRVAQTPAGSLIRLLPDRCR